METLWAPWRSAYLNESMEKEAKKIVSGCVFCEALAQPDDRSRYIVHRGPGAFVILNLYPYNNGHMLIIPNVHVDRLDLVPAETRAEVMELINRAQLVLQRVYQPHGINIGNNTGQAAGAGIADHLHFHVLPRWTADANFLTTVANSRVIPESLDRSWERIREAWEKAA